MKHKTPRMDLKLVFKKVCEYRIMKCIFHVLPKEKYLAFVYQKYIIYNEKEKRNKKGRKKAPLDKFLCRAIFLFSLAPLNLMVSLYGVDKLFYHLVCIRYNHKVQSKSKMYCIKHKAPYN
jgi:hypothetical protein